MPHRVFISHSFHDQRAAQTVCGYLEQNGIDCWIAPRNITPGQNFGAAIIEAINRTELLLVLFSSKLEESHHAVREIERAVSKGLNILPVLIEDASPTGSYEYLLCNLHCLNASKPPFESHLGSILDSVRIFLNQDCSGQSPFPPATYQFPEAIQAGLELEIVGDNGHVTSSVPIGQALSIGRTRGDAVIPDPGLSDIHCRLVPAKNGLTVEDLGSQNGVYIRIDEEVELNDQDRISIGTLLFRIEEVGE
ncbi:MAG: TIR domain-containing protein [Methylococcaceae bacterium]|nr:TIR domain-containing protein [Methylococcaceae bacterium]